MTDIIKRLQEYNSKHEKKLYVEELDLTFFYTPITYGEIVKARELSTVGVDKNNNPIIDDTNLSIYLIIEKCKDQEGKKIFSLSCYNELKKLPLLVSSKIATAIEGNIAEAKKK